MRFNIVILANIITMLIAFTIVAKGSGPIPNYDNPRGYIHCRNAEGDAGRLWINTVSDDNESAPHNHKSGTQLTSSNRDYGFPIREGPENESGLVNNFYFTP